MFPPSPNIYYHLLRPGNVELTMNRMLERGFLEPPPGTFHTLYPSPATGTQGARTNANVSNSAPTIPSPLLASWSGAVCYALDGDPHLQRYLRA
ncbi:hypothetical protein DFP72DRAFT_1082467 [Ephemerocybe angulata]|uniref:Uncharacterized protein n=1 Tax=Ephemerocybe angulata TaxID=980116 RepID=A0A8H6H808_9AGAR|nr:hypothetical protein DFP72DRAFT_1082467 [Tulosesus angulatus]